MSSDVPWRVPSDTAINDILIDRIQKQRDGVGIVVGVIDRCDRRVISHGSRKRRGKEEVTADTVFEIGSITKVFTSLLLSDMAQREEVTLGDPIAKYLPQGVNAPGRNGREITLADLATHTSGLPRLPGNFAPRDRHNPYADYTSDQLYAFLRGHTLTRDIAERYEYSNVAVGLLGHLLGRRAGTDFERLLNERIIGPLALSSTAISLTPELQSRLAQGYDQDRRPAPLWDLLDPTAGAGAIRSTAGDLLNFLAAVMGCQITALTPAINAQLAFPTRSTGVGGFSVGLGWHVTENQHGKTIWHNGGSGGFRAFLGFNPVVQAGVVVLTNTATTRGGDDIGQYILAGSPLVPAPRRRREVSVTEAVLDGYVGAYRYATGRLIEITREGGDLFANVGGQGAGRICAACPTSFFWRSVTDAELTFETGADGRAHALVTLSSGRKNRAVRVSSDERQ